MPSRPARAPRSLASGPTLLLLATISAATAPSQAPARTRATSNDRPGTAAARAEPRAGIASQGSRLVPWWRAAAQQRLGSEPVLALDLARSAASAGLDSAAWRTLQRALDQHLPVQEFALGNAAPTTPERTPSTAFADTADGLLTVTDSGWLSGFRDAPDGLAPVFAHETGTEWSTIQAAHGRAILASPGRGWQGTVLFDVTGTRPRELQALIGARASAFASAGGSVVAALRGGGIARFDAADGTELDLRFEDRLLTSVAVLDAGHIVGAGPEGLAVEFADGRRRVLPRALGTSPPPVVEAAPRSARIAFRAPGALTATVFDLERWQVIAQTAATAAPILDLGFGPNGARLWVRSGDPASPQRGRITVFDATTGARQLRSAAGARAVALSFDDHAVIAGGRYAPASLDEHGEAEVFRLPTSPDERPHPIGKFVDPAGPFSAVAFVGSGDERIATAAAGRVRVWPRRAGLERRTVADHSGVPIQLAAIGPHLVSVGLDRQIFSLAPGPRGFDEPGRQLDQLDADPLRLAVSTLRTGSAAPRPIAVVADETGAVGVYDLDAGLPVGAFRGHRDAVAALAVDADGHIASGSMDGRIALWHAREPATAARWLDGHAGPVYALAFDPRGRWLASVGHDASLRVWNVRTGELLDTAYGHRTSVDLVCWNPAGTRIVTGGNEPVARLWTVDAAGALGEAGAPLRGHVGGVGHARFVGDQLVTAAGDGTLRYWPPTAADQPIHTVHLHRAAVDRRASIRGMAAIPTTADGVTGGLVTVGADATLCIVPGPPPDGRWPAPIRLPLAAAGTAVTCAPAPLPETPTATDRHAVYVGLVDGRVQRWTLDPRGAAQRIEIRSSATQRRAFELR